MATKQQVREQVRKALENATTFGGYTPQWEYLSLPDETRNGFGSIPTDGGLFQFSLAPCDCGEDECDCLPKIASISECID